MTRDQVLNVQGWRYDVQGSVCLLFWNLHHRGVRGRKGGECKFLNEAHRTFDIINTSTPCTFVCTLRTGRSTFTAAGVQFDHHNILTFVYSLHPILMYLIGKGYDRPEWYNGTPAILGGRGERKVSFGGDPWLNRQFYRDLESNSFIHMMWKVELKIPAKLGKFGFQTSASLRHLVMLSRNLEGICLLNPEAALPLSYIAPISILNQVLLEINANRLNDEVCSEIGRGSDGEFAHCQIMQSFTVIGPRLRESHIGP